MDEEMSTISDAAVDDLTFDPDVDASGITVEDGDGDVVLTGSVPSRLKVALPPGDFRDDPTLTAMANDALTLGRTVAVAVEATAKNGEVTLSGAVRDGAERAAAEAMIADLTGVRRVRNDIQVRNDAGPLHPDNEPVEKA